MATSAAGVVTVAPRHAALLLPQPAGLAAPRSPGGSPGGSAPAPSHPLASLASLAWFFPDSVKSSSARALLVAMLHPEPSRRPTMAQLQHNPWVTGQALRSDDQSGNVAPFGHHARRPTAVPATAAASEASARDEGSPGGEGGGAAAEEALALGEAGLDHQLARALQLSFDNA